MRTLLVVVFVLATLVPSVALAAPRSAPDWEKTLERVAAAVVAIRVRATRDFDTERASGSTGTGFVIDKERGIILTNRHMVHTGPVIAEAVFLDHEEVDLEPIYRDPVHDFGFYRFDPEQVRYMDLVELPLAPDKARVGLEIRVVGNDSGEKISILDGTLARLDRDAPSYGGNTYNDFNTFYLQAASNTSGGSSGSPVVDVYGNVIGLNAGSRTSTASAFYLPLDRIVRAVPFIERAEVPPRGTLQTTFKYTPFDEVRRLGLREELESAQRVAFPESTGMLVVERLVPGGPADGQLRPGDVLVSLAGEPVGDFVRLEGVLDDQVGDRVSMTVERGGEPVQVELTVGDLHGISPAEYLEVGRGILHPLSYMQARNHNVPVAGIFVAQNGYAFGNAGLPSNTVLTNIDGATVSDLQGVIAELETKANGDRVRVRYHSLSDPRQEEEIVVPMDRAWHAMRHCVRDARGNWPCTDAKAPPAPEPREPATAVFSTTGSKAARAIAPSLVEVDFDIPYPTSGVRGSNYHGTGIVVDAERGLVIADRDTVPVRVGDIFLTFGGQVRVPATVEYLHPVHNLVVLSYDPVALGDSAVRSATFVDRDVEAGDRVWQIALARSGELIDYETSVARVGPYNLGPSRTPRFRDVNIEGFSLSDSLGSSGGVIADKKGRVVAAWFSFKNQRTNNASFRAMPATFIQRVLEPLRAGRPVAYRALGAEFTQMSIANARDRGLSDARAVAIREHDPEQGKVLEIGRVWGAVPAADLLRNGDLVLSIDGRPVTRLRDIEALTHRTSLALVVLRDGEEVAVEVPTVELGGEGVTRLVQWAGLIVHAPHREVAAQSGTVRDGIYGSWIWYGTPAFDSSLRPTRHIVEIDGTPIRSVDDLLALAKTQRDRQAVRVTTESLDGRVQVLTMKLDLRFWPTTEVHWDGSQWVRVEIEPEL